MTVDLRIENNDLVFGTDNEPLYLEDSAAIAQDLKHRIRESGLAAELVGTRGAENEAILQKIKLVAKQEERIKPETVSIADLGNGKAQVSAKTLDSESIETSI